jgi:23S rRNA (pseudouridine1915-N3)-methyltransferase
VKVRLLAIGRDRSGLFSPAVQEYLGRLARTLKVELVELPEAKRQAGTPQARDEEGATLLARIKPGERLVALDERGEQPTSVELANRLARWQARGQDVAMVIGGADGLSPAVLERAQERLSLSRLTLPHRLARVVLVEQLYRAVTILRGEPYHKD